MVAAPSRKLTVPVGIGPVADVATAAVITTSSPTAGVVGVDGGVTATVVPLAKRPTARARGEVVDDAAVVPPAIGWNDAVRAWLVPADGTNVHVARPAPSTVRGGGHAAMGCPLSKKATLPVGVTPAT